MGSIEKTSSFRRIWLLICIVLEAVFAPIFPMPTAQDDRPPLQVSAAPGLRIEKSHALAKTHRKIRPNTVHMTKRRMPSDTDLVLPDLQLILPAQQSCWSHASSVNPQGSQDDGDFEGPPDIDLVHLNPPSDPLLNRSRPGSHKPK
jgi:hypothetical protein